MKQQIKAVAFRAPHVISAGMVQSGGIADGDMGTRMLAGVPGTVWSFIDLITLARGRGGGCFSCLTSWSPIVVPVGA